MVLPILKHVLELGNYHLKTRPRAWKLGANLLRGVICLRKTPKGDFYLPAGRGTTFWVNEYAGALAPL